MITVETPDWAEHPELVEFYSRHRNRPDDLYPSERRFLPWLARQAGSVLDVGCAAGGFAGIWRQYQPAIRYTGVDVSDSLIRQARMLHPSLEFQVGNCADGLPFPDREFAVVQALGWLHWEPRYAAALRELWRVCSGYLFFDVRLAADEQAEVHGRQQLSFTGTWDGRTTTPYICVTWSQLGSMLFDLQPQMILGYGYQGKPAGTVMGVHQQVCFATFVLKRGDTGACANSPLLCLDLPLDWRRSLTVDAEVLPPSRLGEIVPAEVEA